TLEPPYFWTTIDICLFERRDYRRMIAGPELAINYAGVRACRERLAREHIIEPPPDITLPHVPPRRPPREQTVIVGIESASQIHEPAAQNPPDDRPLLQ